MASLQPTPEVQTLTLKSDSAGWIKLKKSLQLSDKMALSGVDENNLGESAIKILTNVIVDWNITDPEDLDENNQEKKAAITPENVNRIPDEDIVMLIEALNELVLNAKKGITEPEKKALSSSLMEEESKTQTSTPTSQQITVNTVE